MKPRIYHIIYIVCLLLFYIQADAQEKYTAGTHISVKEVTTNNINDSLYIKLSIEASGLQIKNNESLQLNLFLRNENKQIEMPPVIYSGKRRRAFDLRNQILTREKEEKPYRVFVGIDKNKKYSTEYRVRVLYREWMANAEISVQQLFNDCCNEHILKETTVFPNAPQAQDSIGIDREDNHIYMADIHKPDFSECIDMVDILEPQIQDIFINHYTFRLSYPKDVSDIQVDYENNAEELNRLNSILESNPSVPKSISIAGYASPEGMYFKNEQIAKDRSLKFGDFLAQKYFLNRHDIYFHWVAENWTELENILRETKVYYSQEAIQIINSVGIFEGRERILMDLDRGDPYRDMFNKIFPKLRYVDLQISYDSPLQVKKSIDLLFSNPEIFSLDEILKIAQNYPVDSPEYKEVYTIAAKLFSDNDIVNNNVAVAHLINGEINKAKDYLKKIKDLPSGLVNLGVCFYMEGELEVALDYFSIAAKADNKKAIDNLLLIKNR